MIRFIIEVDDANESIDDIEAAAICGELSTGLDWSPWSDPRVRYERASTLNAPCNDNDALVLRRHIRNAHPSLLETSIDGPLPDANLDDVPNDVLAAIHTANHLLPWSQHTIDDWKA